MGCFVITRCLDNGETVLDYLSKNGYSWVESGAVAKWFHSEKEAYQFVEKRPGVCENVFVRSYDPVDTLLHPTEADRQALLQEAMRKALAGDQE